MNGRQIENGATVLGRGCSLRGELTARGDVTIEGTLEGLIHAQGGRLTVGPEARVLADVTAHDVMIMGRLEGNIRASERVELRAGASVTGDVFAKRFAIEEEASFRGRVDPSRSGDAADAAGDDAAWAQARPAAAQMPEITHAAEEAQGDEDDAGDEGRFGLFSGSARPGGKMPAGLAAAARTLTSANPAGMNALADDAAGSDDNATPTRQ